jgi:holliday junction DNA helicase RuvA
MIGRLSGLLAGKSPPMVLLDVHGVGYEVSVPMSTFCELPPVGGSVVLMTHLVVREDAQMLFGFLTVQERTTFAELVKIGGVGPRTALAILSGLSVTELASAVARQDAARLVKVPGIGKKTADRLLLELRGRLDAGPVSHAAPDADRSDIAQALRALGYNDREAQAAVDALPTGIDVGDGIKLALKALNR